MVQDNLKASDNRGKIWAWQIFTVHCHLQLTITARDLGSPSRAAINTATVTVNVNRNNNPPVFRNTPYDVTISTPAAASSSVRAITVTDSDLVVGALSSSLNEHRNIRRTNNVLPFFFLSLVVTTVASTVASRLIEVGQ